MEVFEGLSEMCGRAQKGAAMIEHETFWSLLHDPAHWQFEIFLMVLFDGLLFGMLWPFLKKHWRHHIDRDRRDTIPFHIRRSDIKDIGSKVKFEKADVEAFKQMKARIEEDAKEIAKFLVDTGLATYKKKEDQ